ncbi:hypothetical protein BH10PSE17_BH10PSE17_23550 [soil metagenome]
MKARLAKAIAALFRSTRSQVPTVSALDADQLSRTGGGMTDRGDTY